MHSGVMPDRARWLSVRRASEIYGLSRATWWRLSNKGKITAARFGARCLRLDRESIDRLFAEHVVRDETV